MMDAKRYSSYVCIVVAGLLVGIFAKLILSEIWNRPVAFIESTVFDFGEVGTEQVYTAVFKIQNKGRAPLTVNLKKAACTCTIAEMCKSPILPGEESVIRTRMKAPNVETSFGSQIAIETNDPKNQKVILTMQGKSASVLNIAPLNLSFGNVLVEDLSLRKKIVISEGKLAKSGMLESLFVTCNHPGLDLRVVKSAKKVVVDVGLCKDICLGVVRAEIKLKIEELDSYTLNIPVVLHVKGDYEIHPASLFFGKVEDGTSVTKECIITPFNSQDILELIIDESEMSDSSLPLGLEIEHIADRAIIRGTFKAGNKKSVFEKTLKFKLTPNDGSAPQYLQIPAIAVTSG